MVEHEELMEAFKEELEVKETLLRKYQKDLKAKETEVQILKAA